MLASEAQQRARATRSASGRSAEGVPRLRPPRREPACCATSSSARAAAPARSRPAWSPRRRASRGRRSTCTRSIEGARRRHRRPDRRARRRAPAARSSAACASRSRTRAFFQTNTEMAERLYAIAAEFAGPDRQRAGLRPLLRDRHDRPLAGRARPARSGASRSSPEAVADAERNADRNGIENARFLAGRRPHRDRAPARGGGQARRGRRRPAARRASRRRSSAG